MPVTISAVRRYAPTVVGDGDVDPPPAALAAAAVAPTVAAVRSPTTTAPAGAATATGRVPAVSDGSSSAFPDASNTGVPTGVSLTNSGSLTATTAGVTYDALNISGGVYINANNVTLRRSRITGSSFWVIQVASGRTGVVIEDCEIDGTGDSEGNGGVGGPATVRRCDIWNVENGLVPGNGSVMEDNYMHDLLAPGSPHYDGIQIDGGSNMQILHNTVDMSEHNQTAAVMMDNYFGATTDITVTGNRLLGGGYTIYADGQFRADTLTGIVITNNRIGGGYWGDFTSNNAEVTWSGNVDDATGQPI